MDTQIPIKVLIIFLIAILSLKVAWILLIAFIRWLGRGEANDCEAFDIPPQETKGAKFTTKEQAEQFKKHLLRDDEVF